METTTARMPRHNFTHSFDKDLSVSQYGDVGKLFVPNRVSIVKDCKIQRREVLLAIPHVSAGFLLGPGGRSIRDIEQRYRVSIKSKNADGMLRYFQIQGANDRAVEETVQLVTTAVNKFYQLEDACTGAQTLEIGAVTFFYQPAPFAASLANSADRIPVPRTGHDSNLNVYQSIFCPPLNRVASQEEMDHTELLKQLTQLTVQLQGMR